MAKFEQLIKINVDDKSLKELDTVLHDIDYELKSIKKSEQDLNITDEERAKNLQAIQKLEQKSSETAKRRNAVEKDLSLQQEIANKKTKENLERTQQRAESFFKVAEGIGGAFNIGKAAALAFGSESAEAIQKLESQVFGLIALTDSVKKISEATGAGFKLLGANISKVTTSTSTFGKVGKAAFSGIGIGLIITGLALIITYFDEIVAYGKELSQSLGLTDLIDSVEVFTTSIGGLGGIIKVTGAALKLFVTEIVAGIQFLYHSLSGQREEAEKDVEKLKDNAKKFGAEYNKIVEDAAKERAKVQRGYRNSFEKFVIDGNAKDIERQKAQGKDVLKLEEQLLIDRLALGKKQIDNEGQQSEEKDKLIEEQFKNELALIANRNEQAKKYLENRLKDNQISFNKESKMLADNFSTQEDYDEKLYLLGVKTLQNEIALRKKAGEDITALDLTLSQTLLEHRKQVQEKAISQQAEALDAEYKQRVISLQNDFTTEEKFNDEKEALDAEFLDRKLKNAKDGSIEELDLEIQKNENIIKEKIEVQKKIDDLNQYFIDKEKSNNIAIVQDASKSFSSRLRAAKDLNDNEQKILNEKQKAYQKDSLEYQKINDQKIASEAQFTKTKDDLTKQQIAQIETVTTESLNVLNAYSTYLDQLSQNRIDTYNKNVEILQSKNTDLQTTIDETTKLAEESNNKIMELETKLSDARNNNSAQLKQQLEDERTARDKEIIQSKKLTKEKIENEKKIAEQQKKIAAEEIKQKRRDQTIAISTATVNTSLGFTKALSSSEPPLNFVLAAAVLAAGLEQVATISNQKFKDGGLVFGPSHEQGGVRGTGSFSNIEVEGNEFIVNKRSTQKYLPLLQQINESKYAEGGTLPNFSNINQVNSTNDLLRRAADKSPVVSVKEIIKEMDRVKVLEANAKI